MRPAILAMALFSAACARELRSRNADAWVELRSEHFALRTDLAEADARSAITDLELLRNALLSAGWHTSTMSTARINVVALRSEKELHEFVGELITGITTSDHFGEPLIVVGEGADLLHSEAMKHELTHVLTRAFLLTKPRWVSEGIACYLETLEVNRDRLTAVRGKATAERLNWLHYYPWRKTIWSLRVMGMGSSMTDDTGFEFETLSWALVHWLADTRPNGFRAFLTRLSRGEAMWNAFAAAFPYLNEEKLSGGMKYYLDEASMLEESVEVPAWNGGVALRHIAPADVHALRAQLFRSIGGKGPAAYDRFQSELAEARALDPGNPLALSLSPQRDARLAVEKHPDDWRSWVLWFDDHDRDGAAIRKAAALAPDNPGVLIRLAYAEQDEGKTKEAVRHAEEARSLHPVPYVLTALAWIYDANGRCAEAVATQRRAIDALSDSVSPERPVEYRKRLIDMENHCAQPGARRTVEAEPVLKLCRQPLKQGSTAGVSAHFTVREDGSVTAVAIQGARSDLNGELRGFVESCTFEPVLVDGKPRPVQLDLKLDDLLQ